MSGTGVARVLVVDDHDDNVTYLKALLEAQGYAVSHTRDPEAALSIAEEGDESIDLLLSDLVLPAMNGPELATRIARKRPRLRVAFMSGYAAETPLRPGAAPSDIKVLQKPFSSDALLSHLRDVLDR